MPPVNDQEVETLPEAPEDRRDAIEAAFEAASNDVEGVINEDAPAKPIEAKPVEAAKPADEAEAPEGVAKPEKPFKTDNAPQSWKAVTKGKWEGLDPEVKIEVMRREREIAQGLSQSAGARQFAQQFEQTVAPYMAKIQSLNIHPMQAVQELLKADHLLSTAPKTQRAQYMAEMIRQYDVDFRELDAALAGTAPPDPVANQVETMLQQRLAPFQSFMQQQAEFARQQEEQQDRQAVMTIDQMQADTEKFPHFEQVRLAMADLIEFSAARGRALGVEAAYNQAIAMDSDLQQQVIERTIAERAASTAKTLNGRAQRALNASVSVGGVPGGGIGGAPAASDRRAVIEAAFNASANR